MDKPRRAKGKAKDMEFKPLLYVSCATRMHVLHTETVSASTRESQPHATCVIRKRLLRGESGDKVEEELELRER